MSELEVLPNATDEKDQQALQYIEDVTNDADEIQRRVLTEILSVNADVEYLKRHGLNGCTDASTFKKVMPVISYEELKPYIQRIADGDNSPILCTKPITEFFISTGTSGGEPKLIPIFEEEFQRRLFLSNLALATIKQSFPGLNKGKGMYFVFAKPKGKTRGGIVARPLLTSLCQRPQFKYVTGGSNTSPIDIILCTDSFQSLYCQLLCGLCQNEEVLHVDSVFASTLIRIIKFLENYWVLLVDDIRTGTLNSKITDTSVRESVMKILKPNPQLADFIESECSKRTWKGIITRLWPNTKYIKAIVTGTMSLYIPMLDYYSNGLPIVCTSYISSESCFGLNLNLLGKLDEISYTFIPTMAYFEFLAMDRGNGFSNSTCGPEAHGKVSQELVDLVDVKLGEEYEIVVTTYAGLYRYRVGDIVRVTGFKNKAPQFRFVCRKNVVLSLDYEKTDEAELQNAVKEATRLLSSVGATLSDYTSYADSSSIPGHYVLYWEICENEGMSIPSSIYEECCFAVEESLSSVYHHARCIEKCIGALEIKIVEVGTFDELMDQAVNQGASMTQYKTPRCIKSPRILELLNSKVVSNYFSQNCPKWDHSHRHSLLTR